MNPFPTTTLIGKKMKFLVRIFVFALVVACYFLTPASYAEVANEDEASASSIKKSSIVEIQAEGYALYQNRQNKYHLGTIGASPTVTLGVDPNAVPLQFDTDHWGGGYQIDVTALPEKQWSWGASFQQYFIRETQTISDLPGQTSGQLTEIPFLNGQPVFEPAAGINLYGFVLSGDPSGTTPNVPGTAKFTYHLQYDAIQLTPRYRVVEKPSASLHFYAGPSFAYFNQDYKVDTIGQNAAFPFLTANPTALSTTYEKLKDFLYGGRLGAEGKWNFFKGFFVNINQAFDLFFRQSRLWGAQDMNNVPSGSNVGAVFTTSRQTIRDTAFGFTPHMESKFELGYIFNKNFVAKIFYQFDGWLNLSRVQNSVISSNSVFLLEGPTRIESENSCAQYIGGSLTVNF